MAPARIGLFIARRRPRQVIVPRIDRKPLNGVPNHGTSGAQGDWWLRPGRYHTHAWQGEMIDRYIRWRNARAQPQTSFAPISVICTWTDYKINVA